MDEAGGRGWDDAGGREPEVLGNGAAAVITSSVRAFDMLVWLVRVSGGSLMAEGLNPIEAGKKLHEHGETPHRAEPGEGHDGGDARHSRIVQICEALLLALVTITAAWAGYSAARWGTASRVDVAESSTLRNLATRDNLTALSLRDFDASTFNAWFLAYTLNSPQKEAIAERRFRPEFRVAFDAWLATDPLHNPNAPPGPTYMPQYQLPAQTQANQLDSEAAAKFQAGNHAGLVGDDYVRITVFLAAVLFLVGESDYKHQGERVVRGQRLTQAAADPFLGWTSGIGTNGAAIKDYYVRQLRDMKGSMSVPLMDPPQLNYYGRLCGWALARAHARTGRATMISGYLGMSEDFDRAIADFAVAYADQNQQDYQRLLAAISAGRVLATMDQ